MASHLLGKSKYRILSITMEELTFVADVLMKRGRGDRGLGLRPKKGVGGPGGGKKARASNTIKRGYKWTDTDYLT